MVPARVSVILPTYNPDLEKLHKTLEGLRFQSLRLDKWELIVVDNASCPPVDVDLRWHPEGRLVGETNPGLTSARLRGFRESGGDILVLVDDDNVLDENYLGRAVQLIHEHSGWGVCGGKVIPQFEAPPPVWLSEFTSLLACRDLGDQELASGLERDSHTGKLAYPSCSPVGAGMVLRKEAVVGWMDSAGNKHLSDRKGACLSSAGDNDIVFTLLKAGWQVAYSPELTVTHLIGAHRCTESYLSRLNEGIMKSWVEVLEYHGANHWPPIPPWTLPLRICKAWLTFKPWKGSKNRIRWAGACGQLKGQASIYL